MLRKYRTQSKIHSKDVVTLYQLLKVIVKFLCVIQHTWYMKYQSLLDHLTVTLAVQCGYKIQALA